MKNLKSKIISFALAFCFIVPCMLMLTACDSGHMHVLEKVDAKDATCGATGNTLYYKCNCGKYYSDEKAETEIEENSWVIAKTGHTYASDWTYNDTHHWKEATCSHTGEKSEYAEHNIVNNACTEGCIIYTVADSDAWNEVFSGDYLNNVTAEATRIAYKDSVDNPYAYIKVMQKATETAMETRELYDGDICFSVKDNDKYYYVVQDQSGNWLGKEETSEDHEVNSCKWFTLTFVDKFELFEYDSTNHSYVMEGEFEFAGDIYNKAIVYIENGKVLKAKIICNEVEDGLSGLIEYTFFNYGTTVIDNIPEWTPAP